LNKFWRGRVSEFLNRDPATLVPLHKVTQLLIEGKKLQIEPENYHIRQLQDVLQRASELQGKLKDIRRYGVPSYTEAKYFFSELFSIGINIQEADFVREIIKTNVPIETSLNEELTREKLIDLRDMLIRDDQKLINADLQRTIVELCAEYENLDAQIKLVIGKPYVDFADLNLLEQLKQSLKKSKLKLNYDSEFNDLFVSYSWVIKTALEHNVKASS